MMNKEEAVLQVRDLLLRYGNGCECCWDTSRSSRRRNKCRTRKLTGTEK